MDQKIKNKNSECAQYCQGEESNPYRLKLFWISTEISEPWLGWPWPYTPTLTSSSMASLNNSRTPGVSIYMHCIQIHMEHYENYMRGSLVTHCWLWVLKSTVLEISVISISSLPWKAFETKWTRTGLHLLPCWSHTTEWVEPEGHCCWDVGWEIWLANCHLPRSESEWTILALKDPALTQSVCWRRAIISIVTRNGLC